MKPRSRAAALVAGLSAGLLAPAQADAHISLHPNTVPAGAFATVDVRVPGEQEGAHVTRVDVLAPPGFTSAETAVVPGWRAQVIRQHVSPPIQTDAGPVSEDVSQILWTWTGPAGEVGDNEFIEFPLSFAVPASDSGQALLFKTVQAYSNGQVVHWIDPSLSAEHPAPRINVTARGGSIEDVAGAEAGPEAHQGEGRVGLVTPLPARAGGGGASEGVAIAALAVAVVSLLAALGALVVRRRDRSGA
jgi:uncharacterized protein YcnI